MFRCFAYDLPRASWEDLLGLRKVAPWALLVCLGLAAPAQQTSTSFGLGELSGAPLGLPEGGATPDSTSPGSVCGSVKDFSGVTVAGAVVTLATVDPSRTRSTPSGNDGVFLFAGVPSGPYKLTVATPGFNLWNSSGSLQRGQSLNLSDIALSLSSTNTEVEVRASNAEVTAAQISLEEKQRVLGVFPNFYASYIWDAGPLTSRQKFSLAWRFSVDPVAFAMTGVIAGTEQSENSFSGYGQGARGYARRFGANYADGFTSTMIGQAILPSIFHQDPRYFVKGTGSIRARALYAIATTVICKGDNRRWQLNYSNILGNVAAAGISNLYYPASSRHGAGLTIQNSLVTTASGALGGLIQEFLLHRMTPHIPDYGVGIHP
jgi:hypothetical protein